MVNLDSLVFRVRALAQSHPFSPRGYRYLNERVAQERASQPVPEVGIWAGHAITVGYSLRCAEEEDAGRTVGTAPEPLPDDLDAAATHIASLLRTEGAGPYLLRSEERVVEALDQLIAGEIDRRVGSEEGISDEAAAELAEYLAWWVIKGYALRVAEPLVPEPDEA